ncbi:MAG: hypothetical protein ABII71_03030 [Candidatus Micrarchaeota archaeon]
MVVVPKVRRGLNLYNPDGHGSLSRALDVKNPGTLQGRRMISGVVSTVLTERYSNAAVADFVKVSKTREGGERALRAVTFAAADMLGEHGNTGRNARELMERTLPELGDGGKARMREKLLSIVNADTTTVTKRSEAVNLLSKLLRGADAATRQSMQSAVENAFFQRKKLTPDAFYGFQSAVQASDRLRKPLDMPLTDRQVA